MSGNLTTFEAVVRVRSAPAEYWDGKHYHRYKWGKLWKMFHFDAPNHRKAMEKARRYGIPVSVRKVDVSKIFGNIEHLVLEEHQDNAIALEDFIWRKKGKRAERLENHRKDRENIDNL